MAPRWPQDDPKMAPRCFTENIRKPCNLESKNVTSVTLSYTFYEIDLPETASYLENNKDFETINLKL